jgi:regulator of extracellular matrix RemA (YlzA/DUF370 family)
MNGQERIDPQGRYLHVGFDHTVALPRVAAILAPGSSPLKRLKARAREEGRLLDATSGRRTRSIIVLDSNQVVLSAVAPETLWRRAGAVSAEPAVISYTTIEGLDRRMGD